MSVTILRKVNVTGGTVLRAANNLGDVADPEDAFANIKQAATSSATGVVELATLAEGLAQSAPSATLVPAVDVTTAMVNRVLAAVMGADYLQSDGATSNRRIETQYGTVAAGIGDWTFVDFAFDVGTSNPGSNAYIFYVGPDVAPSEVSNNALLLMYRTDGSLRLRQNGATGSADFRFKEWANFRSTYSGQRVRGTLAFTGNSATAPVLWIHAMDMSANFGAETTGGTVPNWVPTSQSTTYFFQFANWPAAYVRPGRPVNRKYAQADVDFVQLTGRLLAADAAGGSMVDVHTSDFSAGTDSYASDTSTLAGNIDTSADGTGVPPSDNWLRATSNALGQNVAITKPNAGLPRSLGVGGKLRIRASVFCETASAATHVVVYQNTVTSSIAGAAITAGSASSIDVTLTLAAFFTTTDRIAIGLSLNGTSAGSFASGTKLYLKDVRITIVGALSDPIIQPILVVADSTQNGIGSLVVGFSPVTSKKDWCIQAQTNLASNQQLLGGSVFALANKNRIDSWTVNCASGTPTVSLGNVSAGAQYDSATVLAAGLNEIALDTRFAATTNLWCVSTTTAVNTHTIHGRKVD